MQEQLNNIESQVGEIRTALLGSEFNDKGLIKRIGEIEDYQNKDKKQKWMIAGGFVVITFLSKYIHKIFS